jgi:hypothetical protein
VELCCLFGGASIKVPFYGEHLYKRSVYTYSPSQLLKIDGFLRLVIKLKTSGSMASIMRIQKISRENGEQVCIFGLIFPIFAVPFQKG